MKTRIKRTTRQLALGLALIAFTGVITTTTGCRMVKKHWNPIDMNAQLDSAPPIRVEIENDLHMLIMQAPNPGWTFAIDSDEVLKDSTRISITIRRPDPAFAYPQMIVEKNLLTDIRSHRTLEVFARVLDADEKTKQRGYQLLDTVKHFED